LSGGRFADASDSERHPTRVRTERMHERSGRTPALGPECEPTKALSGARKGRPVAARRNGECPEEIGAATQRRLLGAFPRAPGDMFP